MHLSSIFLCIIGAFNLINAQDGVKQHENNNRYTYSSSLIGSYFKLKGRINERLGKITDDVIGESRILIRSTLNDFLKTVDDIENGSINSTPETITEANHDSGISTFSGYFDDKKEIGMMKPITNKIDWESDVISNGNRYKNKTPGVYHGNRDETPGIYHDNKDKTPGGYHGNKDKSPGVYRDNKNETPGVYHGKKDKTPGVYHGNKNKTSGVYKDEKEKSPGENHDNKKKPPKMNHDNKKKLPEVFYIEFTDAKGKKQQIDLLKNIKKSNSIVSLQKLQNMQKTISQIQNIAEFEKDLYNINELHQKIKALESEADSDEDLEVLLKFQSRLSSRAQKKDFSDAVLSVRNISRELESFKLLDRIIQLQDKTNDSLTNLNSKILKTLSREDIFSTYLPEKLFQGFTNIGQDKINSVISKIQDYVDLIHITKIINTDIFNKDNADALRNLYGDDKLKTLMGKMYNGKNGCDNSTTSELAFRRWAEAYRDAIKLKEDESSDYQKFYDMIKNYKSDVFKKALNDFEKLVRSSKPEDQIEDFAEITTLLHMKPMIRNILDLVKQLDDDPKHFEILINALEQMKKLQDNLKSPNNYKDILQIYGQISAKSRVLDQLKDVVKLLERSNTDVIDNPDDLTKFRPKLDKTFQLMSSAESITEFKKDVAELKRTTSIINSVPTLRRQLERVEVILNNKVLPNFINTLQRVNQTVNAPTELMQFRQLLGIVKKVAKTTKDVAHLESALKGVKRLSEVESNIGNLNETLDYVKSAEKIDEKEIIIEDIEESRRIFGDGESLFVKLDTIEAIHDSNMIEFGKSLDMVKMLKNTPDGEDNILMAIATLQSKTWNDWNELLAQFDAVDDLDFKTLYFDDYCKLYTNNIRGKHFYEMFPIIFLRPGAFENGYL